MRLQRQQEAALRQIQAMESPEKLHKNSPKIINPKNILYSERKQRVPIPDAPRSGGNAQSATATIPRDLILQSEASSSFNGGLPQGRRTNKTAMDKRGADRQIKLALTRMSQESKFRFNVATNLH